MGQTKDRVCQYQSGFGGLLSFGLQSLVTGLGQNSNTFTTLDYSNAVLAEGETRPHPGIFGASDSTNQMAQMHRPYIGTLTASTQGQGHMRSN